MYLTFRGGPGFWGSELLHFVLFSYLVWLLKVWTLPLPVTTEFIHLHRLLSLSNGNCNGSTWSLCLIFIGTTICLSVCEIIIKVDVCRLSFHIHSSICCIWSVQMGLESLPCYYSHCFSKTSECDFSLLPQAICFYYRMSPLLWC